MQNNIYDEYLCYKNEGYKPGEEYDLTEVIADELNLIDFISLGEEKDFINPDNKIEQAIEAIKRAPSHDDRVESNRSFTENHQDGQDPAETSMMTMFMLASLEEFSSMPIDKIRIIAIEIAVVGMNSIIPQNKGYKINSLPKREFGGYEMLAYYYVSWAKAFPEKLNSLGLPFSVAYNMALELFKKEK